jgi:hypothetical protein
VIIAQTKIERKDHDKSKKRTRDRRHGGVGHNELRGERGKTSKGPGGPQLLKSHASEQAVEFPRSKPRHIFAGQRGGDGIQIRPCSVPTIGPTPQVRLALLRQRDPSTVPTSVQPSRQTKGATNLNSLNGKPTTQEHQTGTHRMPQRVGTRLQVAQWTGSRTVVGPVTEARLTNKEE